MNTLENIVQHKRSEVQKKKKETTTRKLEDSLYFARDCISLKQRLKSSATGIIAEFKRKSPSKGVINDSIDLRSVVTAYEKFGAAGISILTDREFFGGSGNDLRQARELVKCPLLRKDFIIDDYQLVEAKSMGADVILLIAACLSVGDVRKLAAAAKALGLEILLELHDESELGHICEDVDIVGVNNRDLRTFRVNLERSLQMAAKIPVEKVKIAESGINSIEDILLFRQNGFKGALIGELFMREADPGLAFEEFVNSLKLSPPGAEGF